MKHSISTLLANVRVARTLVVDAPASFGELAAAAGLPHTEESAPWGTRYVVDFADLPAANQDSPIVQQLVAIRAKHSEFDQLSIETR